MWSVFLWMAAGGVAVVVFLRWKSSQEDRALERRFSLLHSQARQCLPQEQIDALVLELRELQSIGEQSILRGVSRREARRMVLAGSIQSLANHIHLNRVMPG